MVECLFRSTVSVSRIQNAIMYISHSTRFPVNYVRDVRISLLRKNVDYGIYCARDVLYKTVNYNAVGVYTR